jgi:hypothetical protein
MPQVSDRFDAYPVAVTLDGSGNGTIEFQATGSNIRITNLYAAVSTVVNQAKCTIYKGQIGAQYAINTTNSGSTGASASGSIELLDGQKVYVQWVGGDAGAVATATFTGVKLPFSVPVASGTSFTWQDPIAAGDGSLIFPAIKSPNYVTGVSGWIIRRDGTFELSGGTFRGSLIILDPVTGRGFTITPASGTMGLIPPNSNVGLTTVEGAIYSGLVDSLINGYAYTNIESPTVNGGDRASIAMLSEAVNGEDALVILNPNARVVRDLEVNRNLDVTGSTRVSRWIAGTGTQSSTPPVGAAETVALTAKDLAANPATFLAGRSYRVEFKGGFTTSVANTDILFRVRKTNASGQQINVARFPGRVAATSYDGGWECFFTVGAANITADIVLTVFGAASNVTISAAATSPAEFNIYDDGPASDHPSAAVLI